MPKTIDDTKISHKNYVALAFNLAEPGFCNSLFKKWIKFIVKGWIKNHPPHPIFAVKYLPASRFMTWHVAHNVHIVQFLYNTLTLYFKSHQFGVVISEP